jgi:hypothetical protein
MRVPHIVVVIFVVLRGGVFLEVLAEVVFWCSWGDWVMCCCGVVVSDRSGGVLIEVRFGCFLLSLLSTLLESEIGVSGWLLDHCVGNVVHVPEDSESLPYLERGISKIIIARDCCPRWM